MRWVRLNVGIAALFAALILPVLFLILTYSYYQNSRQLLAMSESHIRSARDDSIAIAASLLEPVASTLAIVAGIAASEPRYFQAEQSRNLLYQALTSAPQIDAVYASFENGYHRVVTRVDDDRRRSDPKVPFAANWHSSYIDEFRGGAARIRHRTFFTTWPTPIAQYDQETSVDIRTLPHYEAAKRSRAFAVGDPSINPDTGFPVISLAYPIIAGNEFIGIAGANITFDVVSKYLNSHRISPNSTALIIDQSDRIIAVPVPALGVRRVDGKTVLASLAEVADPAAARAAQEYATRRTDRVAFTLEATGRDYVALFSPFPPSFRKPWKVVVVAAMDDFLGGLRRTNRNLVILIVSLIAIEAGLIVFAAQKIARPIEDIARRLFDIQHMRLSALSADSRADSFVIEIYHLQVAANLMSKSLQSLARFVPLGIVRQLLATGKSLSLSGESRFLTMFFSDLEDFTSICELLPPDQLMHRVSAYFEAVASAIGQEAGTIDKFIGDSVMAFWGAPSTLQDHVYRGCVGALRASSRIRRLNDDWGRAGLPPMRMRIGLHCADVVVGNVGSTERLNYTVMGDGVNVASRLEGLNKRFRTTICISDAIHDAVGDRLIARPVQLVAIKGRHRRLMVYELMGIRGSTDPELCADDAAAQLCAMTSAAMARQVAGDSAGARAAYHDILDQFPGDPVATLMLNASRPSGSMVALVHGTRKSAARSE